MTRYQIEHTDCAYPATYHTDADSTETAARKVFVAVAAAQHVSPHPDALRWEGSTSDGRACFSAPSGTYFVTSLGPTQLDEPCSGPDQGDGESGPCVPEPCCPDHFPRHFGVSGWCRA